MKRSGPGTTLRGGGRQEKIKLSVTQARQESGGEGRTEGSEAAQKGEERTSRKTGCVCMSPETIGVEARLRGTVRVPREESTGQDSSHLLCSKLEMHTPTFILGVHGSLDMASITTVSSQNKLFFISFLFKQM